MALENVTAFFQKLAVDKDLQNTIDDADRNYSGSREDQKAAAEAIVLAVAKGAGYEFTAAELWEYNAMRMNREMSDDEMESVAGGGLGLGLNKGYRKVFSYYEAQNCNYFQGKVNGMNRLCYNCIYFEQDTPLYGMCKN